MRNLAAVAVLLPEPWWHFYRQHTRLLSNIQGALWEQRSSIPLVQKYTRLVVLSFIIISPKETDAMTTYSIMKEPNRTGKTVNTPHLQGGMHAARRAPLYVPRLANMYPAFYVSEDTDRRTLAHQVHVHGQQGLLALGLE